MSKDRTRKPDLTDFDPDAVTWQTSSFSNGAGGMCVQAGMHDGGVVVRDAKNLDGLVLSFSRAEWAAFVDGVENGDSGDEDGRRSRCWGCHARSGRSGRAAATVGSGGRA